MDENADRAVGDDGCSMKTMVVEFGAEMAIKQYGRVKPTIGEKTRRKPGRIQTRESIKAASILVVGSHQECDSKSGPQG